MADHRVCFDFEVDFSNGGGIQGQGFRLDIDSSDISDDALAASIIRELNLVMVGQVRILDKQIIKERHKRDLPDLAPTVSGNGQTTVLVDLSHTIENGMITYKGLPAPLICDHLSRQQSKSLYAAGTEFQIGRIDMVSNTGTYIDTPFHRYEDGDDLSGVGLARLADLDGLVVRVQGNGTRAIDWTHFAPLDVRDRAVLVNTGWDRHWRTDHYFEGHPYLTEKAATYLRDEGAALVGIDSFNIDDTGVGERPVHTILLGAGIPIVEHMTRLDDLPIEGWRFSATPPKIKGMGTFPVRAYARVVCDQE